MGISGTDAYGEMIKGRGATSARCLCLCLAAKQRGTVVLVPEDFVDDGDDVGDVDVSVVVHVALFG